MPQSQELQRCRLVLIVPEQFGVEQAKDVGAALAGGDVASVIIPQYDRPDAAFQSLAETLVPVIQQAGAAAIIAGDPRIAMRVKADGVHVETNKADLADLIDRSQDRIIVGVGGAKTRDDALELGEVQPDYIFFGRFGYDTLAEPHRRNLTLGRWWAEMIEIPCIVLGGSEIASVVDVAGTGVEFVALSSAVWSHPQGAGEAVRGANAALDENAPALNPGTAHVG